MLTETVSADFARQLEFAEINAWADQWEAIPEQFVQQFQMGKVWLDDVLVLTSPVIQFPHFNRVMGLGLTRPATEKRLDGILALFRSIKVRQLELHHIPHTQPPQLTHWLAARGLCIASGWDRIYRDNRPLADTTAMPVGMQVEKVMPETVNEWATFLVTMYDLQPVKPILFELMERPGWHHYILRDSGELVAARSMYIHRDGMAWWGIEAPVPGFMTPRFDLDYHLCREIVKDGLALGRKCCL
jgi:hypothetical protein